MQNVKIGFVFLLLLFASKITFAQLGTGWSQNVPYEKVHLADPNESLQTYEKAMYVSRGDSAGLYADYTNNEETKTETFKLYGDRSNRSEIRIHDNYGKESRQLEGYVTFFSPIYDQSLIQIWGSDEGATQMMLRGKPQSSGSLALNQEYRSGTPVLMTNCYNKEVKVNVIHYQKPGTSTNGDSIYVFLNDVLMFKFPDDEMPTNTSPVGTNYMKYGVYGTVPDGVKDTLVVTWRDVKYFVGGIPPGLIIQTLPAAPSVIKATALPENRVNLTWTDNSDNEDLFRIEQSLDGVDFTPIASVAADVNFYQVSGLSSDANYFFRIKAENSAGSSEYSNTDSVSTSNTNVNLFRFNDREIGTGINQFEYVGGFWNVILNQTDNFNNDLTENKISEEYVIFRFAGKQISLYGQKNSFSGIAAISIDNGPDTDGDFFSQNEIKKALIWTSPVLEQGEHVLKVKMQNKKNALSSNYFCRIDFVEVLNEPEIISGFRIQKNAASNALFCYPTVLYESQISVVTFRVTEPSKTTLSLVSVNGNVLENLADGFHACGVYHVNLKNKNLKSGIYIIKMVSANTANACKIIVP